MIRTAVLGPLFRASRASVLHLASGQSSTRTLMTLQDHVVCLKSANCIVFAIYITGGPSSLVCLESYRRASWPLWARIIER